LRRNGIPAAVVFGGYDTVVQDAPAYAGSDAVILWIDFANLVEHLPSKIFSFSPEDCAALTAKVKNEISLVLDALNKTPMVLINLLTPLALAPPVFTAPYAEIASAVNAHIAQSIANRPNMLAVNMNPAIATVSITKSVDWRTWNSSKLLYTVEFFKHYAATIAPPFLALHGKSKKVLVFDCDNTLWGGIVGEDGLEGIKCSAATAEGQPFSEVQSIALALRKQGILLALCSKNNPADVDEAFGRHPDMQLRNEHFAAKRVNWNDKASNLREIAAELNLGLESIVFVEDSEFEAELVEQSLPQVRVLRVPESIAEYAPMIRAALPLFYTSTRTDEDTRRVSMYAEERKRESEQGKFGTVDEYLESLDLKISVSVNEPSHIARIAQLTQKTNQFNLTTKRYTETEIREFCSSAEWRVYSFSLADRFGDFGITGAALAKIDTALASGSIDTLLLSCRVLGRNAEIKFFDAIVEDLRANGVEQLNATFIPTAKNMQVESFYDRRGFAVSANGTGAKSYAINVSAYRPSELKYLTTSINHGRTS